MTRIHPTAIIEEGASLEDGVEIGPYCCVGRNVSLGKNVRLLSHVVIEGKTIIGEGTTIYPFASIGHIPQDVKYQGEDSLLEIGNHVTIREHVTINPGTEGGGGITRIGDHGFFLVGCHIAHDCIIGDHVIFSNNATVAGHCKIEDHVVLGGFVGVHQFVHIGKHVFVAALSGVNDDVIPFCTAIGFRAELAGLNIVGLKRRGFDAQRIRKIRKIYQTLFSGGGSPDKRAEDLSTRFSDDPDAMDIANFIQSATRSLAAPRRKSAGASSEL